MTMSEMSGSTVDLWVNGIIGRPGMHNSNALKKKGLNSTLLHKHGTQVCRSSNAGVLIKGLY